MKEEMLINENMTTNNDEGLIKKDLLRQTIKAKMASQSHEDKQQAVQALFQRAEIFMSQQKKAKIAAFYMPLPDEINITPLIRWWSEKGLLFALPKALTKERNLSFHQINCLDSDLQVGAYGILEPKEFCPLICPEKIDIIVVPGVAFDEFCNRLGRGLGYYDRFLKTLPEKTIKVAFALECQIVQQLPVNLNDIPLDAIITDKRIITRPK